MAREGFEAWREQVSTELAKEGRGFDSLRARRRGEQRKGERQRKAHQ